MESRKSSTEIIGVLTGEIGVDASYVRKEQDRLYLTGIEIALIVATGVLSSFLMGLFEGLKKGAKEQGEKIGKELIDSIFEKLRGITEKARKIEFTKKVEAAAQAKALQDQLDEVINDPRLKFLKRSVLDEFHVSIVAEVSIHLRQTGFPEHVVKERAERLVQRLVEVWGDK